MSKINKLKTMCGLPRNYTPTSHCFADSTHQTCCRISENKRRVTDGTGNPIGTPSDNAYNFVNKNLINEKCYKIFFNILNEI